MVLHHLDRGGSRRRSHSSSCRFASRYCIGYVGGVRILLCDAGAGRVQPPNWERLSVGEETIALDESGNHAAAGAKPPLVDQRAKPSTRDGLSGLVRPVVIASGTTAAMTSLASGRTRTPVLSVGIQPPLNTAR